MSLNTQIWLEFCEARILCLCLRIVFKFENYLPEAKQQQFQLLRKRQVLYFVCDVLYREIKETAVYFLVEAKCKFAPALFQRCVTRKFLPFSHLQTVQKESYSLYNLYNLVSLSVFFFARLSFRFFRLFDINSRKVRQLCAVQRLICA